MAKKEVKTEVESKTSAKTTVSDLDCIIEPIITEKTMTQSQESNKFAFKVKKDSNKIQIKNAIERIFNVKVESIRISNVMAKKVSRGSRYKGTVSGYKKAIVTLKEGETINLFAE